MSSALSQTKDLVDAAVRDLANQRWSAIANEVRALDEAAAAKGIVAGQNVGAYAKVANDEIDLRAESILAAIRRASATTGLAYSKRVRNELEAYFKENFDKETDVVRHEVRRCITTGPHAPLPAVSLDATISRRALLASARASTELAYFVQSLRTSRREKRQSAAARAGWAIAGAVGGYLIKVGFDAAPHLWTHR